MKDAIRFLKQKLSLIHNKFPYLEIQYEYRNYTDTHLIEVKPIHCFNSDSQYIEEQIDLEDEFEENYPEENILFFTDNILVQIENPLLKLGVSELEVDVIEINAFKFGTYIHCPEIDIDFEEGCVLNSIHYPPPLEINNNNIKKDPVYNEGSFFFNNIAV